MGSQGQRSQYQRSEIIPSAGLRLRDCEYSSEYVSVLRKWMADTGNENFEIDLIKEKKISLHFDSTLELDFILDALSPSDDEIFVVGRPLTYASLRPEWQLKDNLNGELDGLAKVAEDLQGLELSNHDQDVLYGLITEENSVLNLDLSILQIPEPPYADLCRNSPCDLKRSHLRALRESGYFDEFDQDVRVAAYLIAKGHYSKVSIERFCELISWRCFLRAQSIVHHHILKTWPERFRRIEGFIQTLTKRQREAFEILYDIDLRPTQKQAANIAGIALSSLKERLQGIEKKLRRAFPEYARLRKSKYTRSKKTDLLFNGYYRKSSAEVFHPCTRTSRLTGIQTVIRNSICQVVMRDYTPDEKKKVLQGLRREFYVIEYQAITGGVNRSGYRIRKGEFFHHPKEWKQANMRRRYEDAGFTPEEVETLMSAAKE